MVAPLSWLSEDFGIDLSTLKEGDDGTSIFNIQKLVEPDEYALLGIGTTSTNSGRRTFPPYLEKTDEERIQSIPDILNDIKEENVVITRKEDGTSFTVSLKNDEFLVCSRNFVLVEDIGDWYAKPLAKYKIEEGMRKLGRNIAIQGEVVGVGIQSNRLNLPSLEYRIFNILDLDTQDFVAQDELGSICQTLGLPIAPVLYRGKAKDAPILQSVDALLSYARHH